LPDNISKGLKYVGKINTSIPRHEITKIDDVLINVAFGLGSRVFGVTCGSYRREKSNSGDIDFILFDTSLVTENDIKKSKNNYIYEFVSKLKQQGIIIDSLTGESVRTKYMGICKLSNGDLCRIDIRMIQYESYYPAILYFTGSRDLNKKMRQIADSMGYLLNEYGLYDKNKQMVIVNSEADIFRTLGLEYLNPVNR